MVYCVGLVPLYLTIGHIIATRGTSADPHKQQIPIRLRSGQALHSAAIRSG
jgi:hypothetical protein